jgi:hypothetical protein
MSESIDFIALLASCDFDELGAAQMLGEKAESLSDPIDLTAMSFVNGEWV